MASLLQQVAATVSAGALSGSASCASSSICPSRPPASSVAWSRNVILNLNCALSVKNSIGVCATHRRSEGKRSLVKATDADSDRYTHEVEVLDPKTGEYRGISGEYNKPAGGSNYKVIEGNELEEGSEGDSEDGESEEELLKRFAAAVGLEDNDVVGKLFDKMRNPASDKIVRQLEEGVGDIEDLLMDMFGDIEEFRQLFKEVEKMIDSGDANSARDLVEGNYEALLEQLEDGVMGVEQVAMLDILSHLYIRLGETEAAEQLLQQTKELLDNIPDGEAVAGNILEHLGSMYLKLGKPREALPLFQKSLAVKKELQGDDVPSMVRTMLGLANTYSELNMTSQSIDMYQQILAHAEDALGADDEDLAAPLMHLGSSLLEDGKLDEAELTIQRCSSLESPNIYIFIYISSVFFIFFLMQFLKSVVQFLIVALQLNGHSGGMCVLMFRALNLTEKSFGAADGKAGVAACVLAQVKSAKGEFDAAVNLFKKGLQTIERCPDFAEDENLDTVRVDLAALLNVLGRTEEMNEILEKTGLKDKRLLEYYSSQQVEHLEKLAEHYAENGEWKKSESALRKSLKILTANLGPDAPQVSVVLQLLATLLHAQPDRQLEAEPLARESLRIREKAYGKHHISVAEACSFLASILHEHDKDEEAVDMMYRVVDIQEREYGPDNPELEETLDVLSMLLMNTSRYSETIPVIKKLERLKQNNASAYSM